MGVFDYVNCDYPLPAGAPTEFYQTKDTPAQWLEMYVIREDGSLWFEKVERRWVNTGEGRLKGHMERVSATWERQEWTGEVVFYRDDWEFSAYFVNGQLKHLEPIRLPVPQTVTRS